MKLVKLVGTLLLYFDVRKEDLAISRWESDKLLEKQPHAEIPISKSYFFARMAEPLVVTVTERK